MSKTTTIVLADDHRVVRQGLRLLLESESGFAVVGEAGDGLEAVDLCERLKPNVLVLDLVMPGLGGLDVTRRCRQRTPKTRVVILSMHATDAYVLEALQSGAFAYVLKDAGASELVLAIREAAESRRYLSPPLSEKAIETYVHNAKVSEVDIYHTLTLREREVLHLAAEGLSSTAVAERLGISPRTAETHRTHVMAKLGIHNRTDLIRFALKRGLLPLEQEPSPGLPGWGRSRPARGQSTL